jgi:hypothetical protein
MSGIAQRSWYSLVHECSKKQVFLILRERDFRALQGKHLEGLDFRRFWYTD